VFCTVTVVGWRERDLAIWRSQIRAATLNVSFLRCGIRRGWRKSENIWMLSELRSESRNP
jgi:hypothetical protein